MPETDDTTTRPTDEPTEEPAGYQGLVRVRAVRPVTEILARPEPAPHDPDAPPPPRPNFHRDMVILAAPGPTGPEEPKPKPNIHHEMVVMEARTVRQKPVPSIGSMPVPGGRR